MRRDSTALPCPPLLPTACLADGWASPCHRTSEASSFAFGAMSFELVSPTPLSGLLPPLSCPFSGQSAAKSSSSSAAALSTACPSSLSMTRLALRPGLAPASAGPPPSLPASSPPARSMPSSCGACWCLWSAARGSKLVSSLSSSSSSLRDVKSSPQPSPASVSRRLLASLGSGAAARSAATLPAASASCSSAAAFAKDARDRPLSSRSPPLPSVSRSRSRVPSSADG